MLRLLPLLSTCLAAFSVHAAEPLQASLSIGEPAGPRIEPAIYGQFVEHLGRGVYDGLWVGPESKIPNVRGWRKDAVQALKKIHVPVVRWPGGCFADDYDWRDGIGDPKKRPQRINKVWGNVLETNRVGTHEFMDLAEQIGAEAYIAGNMGSLPPRSMSQWLEYMTADKGSLAEERARNGHKQPWKVPYFGVGNESWGCGGTMRPEYTADLHRQYSTFLRGQTMKVASGDGEGRDEVTEGLMSRAAPQMDALSLHYYTVPGPWDHKGAATGFTPLRWAETMQAAMRIEDRITATESIMDRHDSKKRVALFVDEWGTWHDEEPGKQGALFQQNTMRDALVAALSFNAFHRHTERVKMANIAQVANVLQAMILTRGPQLLLTPTYHVFDMYRPFQGATPLAVELNTPQYREGAVTLPMVQVSAARTAEGKLVLALVNLDPVHEVSVQTGLNGTASGQLLTALEMDAHNEFGAVPLVQPMPYEAYADSGVVLRLPAKSLVVVTLH
ncbi:alpha-N-arabinofuranosidase [Burkholderiaceae bacterium UC74_6]